jgi:hypothetical protein
MTTLPDTIAAERYRLLIDDTPIDEAWLLSIGFKQTWPGIVRWHSFGPLGWDFAWADWPEAWSGELAMSNNRLPRGIKTRGEFRTLAMALKVELKEGA